MNFNRRFSGIMFGLLWFAITLFIKDRYGVDDASTAMLIGVSMGIIGYNVYSLLKHM